MTEFGWVRSEESGDGGDGVIGRLSSEGEVGLAAAANAVAGVAENGSGVVSGVAVSYWSPDVRLLAEDQRQA